jgi:hypothetical protein
MPDPSSPRKTLKDVPAECDALFNDLSVVNFDAIGTRFIGILRVVARDVLAALDDYGKRLKSLEDFREEAVKAYMEAQAAAEAAAKSDAPAEPPAPPKGKPKKNGHAKKTETSPAPETATGPTLVKP